jgi:hypothetical protein
MKVNEKMICKCGHTQLEHRFNPNKKSGFGACFHNFRWANECKCKEFEDLYKKDRLDKELEGEK